MESHHSSLTGTEESALLAKQNSSVNPGYNSEQGQDTKCESPGPRRKQRGSEITALKTDSELELGVKIDGEAGNLV